MTNALIQTLQAAQSAAVEIGAEKKAKAKARTIRAAQKPVAKQESIVVKAAAKIAIKFDITAARPVAGRRLYAYTQAWLELLGMFDGKAHPRATLAKIAGDTAISHHTRKTMVFDSTDAGIVLNSYGLAFFNARTSNGEYDKDAVKAYKAVLTTGKPDGEYVKSASVIRALAV